jgi:hypothetical protein
MATELKLTEDQLANQHIRVHLTEHQKAEIRKATGMDVDAVEIPWKYDESRATRFVVTHQDLVCW